MGEGDQVANGQKVNKRPYSRRKFLKTVSLATIATAGVATFLKKCTNVLGPYGLKYEIHDLVDCAFRLTDYRSLLNLEFYFINCSYRPMIKKVLARYGPHENYMIVRLPQQHMAEVSFDKDDKDLRAATYIAGYSYLVFRILFPDDGFVESMFTDHNGEHTYIPLSKKELLDWGNERKFRLVVRQDLTESLFELATTDYYNNPKPSSIADLSSLISKREDSLEAKIKNGASDTLSLKDSVVANKLQLRLKDSTYKSNFLENTYPFQKIDSSDFKKKKNPSDSVSKDSLRLNKIPKAYGDPITAIEIPWRLIISPKLPDSSRFKFKWEFPETDLSKVGGDTDKFKYQLWTVTLSIAERDDDEYKAKKKAEAEKDKKNQQASTGSLNDVINQLELMILGSPDYPDVKFNPTKEENRSKIDLILPTGTHRKDLVALYIKLKVLARTEKLTLSAIGATVKIHLKNNDIEKALKLPPPIGPVGVIEWNQIISLGRDEKVEVSTLFLEAEFGHKMAYIQIAERQLKTGEYVLIKKAYIMPLDISKDYTNHITQTTDIKDKNGNPQIISRFNAPFKKITFLETKQKELIYLDQAGNQKPFAQDDLNQTQTSFQFEAIDWQDNRITFTKNINALPFGAVVDQNWLKNTPNIQAIIAPKDSSMYDPAQVTSLPGNSIPIIADTSLNNKFIKEDSTTKFVKQIDSSLKVLRSHDDTINSKLFDIQSKNINSSKTIDPSEDILELKNYFDDFFQYAKSKIDLFIKSSNQNIDTFLKQISPSSLEVFLINKYLIPSQKVFIKLIGLKETASDDVFFEKLKGSIKNDLFKENVEVFRDFLNNEDKNGDKKQFINIVANNFESFFTIMKNLDVTNPAQNSDDQFFRYYNRILTDFPEISKQILKLAELFGNAENKVDTVVEQISDKLRLIYQIEKTAEDIPGLILLQKQKIGYAIKEKYDDERRKLVNDLKNKTGEIKKSLSELESEYIIFKGGLRQAENNAFDFFHEYAIIPQVHQAKVYVSALNKLVNEDLPISINYARDYIENQVRDAEFEVKQNAAMVFAEVQQYSREQVKGLIQKIGDKMPGLNVEVPAHFLTYARNPQAVSQEAIDILKREIPAIDGDKIKEYSRDLVFMSDEVKQAVKVMDDLKNIDPKKYFKHLGAKLFGSIGLEDILDIGFDLPRLTQLPDKLIYQVSTDKFKNFQAAFVVFKPNVKSDNPTRLELFISKSLKNAQEYYAYTQLNNFSVGVVIGGTEVLTITFEQFKITSAPNQPKKTDVSITDVKVGGPLEFIADLAKRFMAPGNGMRIKPGPRNLQVDYTIALPDIKAPAFNFRNLQFVIGVNIPYDPSTLKAISFTFGVNKPEDKFLVSAGIYGGRGHFQLRATPKGIEQIDVAIELGAYASIDLGIGKGEVFLFFGFWFVTGKDDNNQNFIKAVAYVICAGSATVLGFITIGVSVLIALTYIKRGEASLFYGEAVVTYSVKIAFFKKEFSIRYYKEIAGSSKGNNTQSLQTGAILLDPLFPGAVDVADDTDARNFKDVFEDEHALEEYLLCFA